MSGVSAGNVAARDFAMAVAGKFQVEPSSLLEYRSRGRVIIIGGVEAIEFAPRLTGNLHAEVLLSHGRVEPGASVIPIGERCVDIQGHLGEFKVILGQQGQHNDELLEADMILDLSDPPLLTMPMKPLGYFIADGTSELSLLAVLDQMQGLTGTFEKPRFFDYNADICAHARSGQTGCRRCIDSCPTVAITSLPESIEVDPYLCQGGGICATVCPTGAIRYVYPQAADTLECIRMMLDRYRKRGGWQPIIGFISEADYGRIGPMPDTLLPVIVEELPSVGIDIWLSSLAYGAAGVRLIQAGSVPAHVEAVLLRQLRVAHDLLEGLRYPASCIQYIAVGDLKSPPAAVMPDIHRATYATLNGKRQTLFLSIDHLVKQADQPAAEIALSPDAPLGRIHVNQGRCTLCMGCASVCPTKAIQAGNDVPRLAFIESNCVQCGLCSAACPEDAIDLEPRLVTDPERRRATQILNEQAAFFCISCGKPFATQSVIDSVMNKLSDHRMYQSKRARRRLMMCGECRVTDAVQDQEAIEPRPAKGGEGDRYLYH